MIRHVAALLALTFSGLLSACAAKFPFNENTTTESIFRTALNLLNDGKVSSAVVGFERLKETLPSRDPLLPRAQWYLGQGYMRQKDFVKAAEAFRRIYVIAPTDSLADDALLASARANRRLWPNPELDDTYGRVARDELDDLLTAYPDTPLREEIFRELQSITDALAEKDYRIAQQYFRVRAYASARTYFDKVLELYPTAARAKDARMRKVDTFAKLNWKDEAREECVVLRQLYPDDMAVRELCRGGAQTKTDPR